MATLTSTTSPQIDGALENLKRFATEKDLRINALFDAIMEQTELLEDRSAPMQKRYERIVETEYLFARLRIIVNDELKRIDYSLTMSEDVTNILAIKSFFTKRKQYLLGVLSRLNELRDDMNVIQRSYYNLKF